MRGLRDLSIKKKMMLIIMMISGVTLLLAYAAIAAFDMILFRRTMSYDLATLAQIIGDNSTAALTFRDQDSAREILSALKGKPHVVFACLYRTDGKVFAEFVRPDMTGKTTPSAVRGEGSRFEQDHLALFHEIFLDQEKIGTLYIQYDLREINARFLRYIGTAAVIIFMAGFVAFLLSSRLQRVISRPILQLVRAAHTVSVEKNYSIRVEKQSRDELGMLSEAFNEMLTQIQDRDDALKKAHHELEARVVERTNELHQEIIERKRAEEALRQSEELLRDMVESMGEGIGIADLEERFTFANPASDHIFGMARGGLVGRDLKEFTTAEQFAVIKEQTKRRQTGEKATYELEVIRPSGEKRIVQVDAIPRFNKQGQYIGSLGVFSDITERRNSEQAIREANEKLMFSVKELEQRNKEMGYFSELYDEIQSCKEEKEIYERTGVYAQKLFPEASGELHLYKASKNFLEPIISWGDLPLREDFLVPDDCFAMRRSKIYKVENPRSDLLCGHVKDSGRQPRPYLCIPLITRDGPIGLLHLEFFKLGETEREELPSVKIPEQLATSFAERVSLALHNLSLSEKLKQQSIRDSLTGLYNRRYMEDAVERDVLRAKRRNDPLGIIMLDLDHFKHFNDTYGHEAGDLMLREVGKFLLANVRQEDMVCRYGGEEFIIALQGASLEVADHRAERLLELSKDLHIQYHGETLGPITFSMGIACLPDHGTTGGEVIVAADMALFQAKKSGRNRIVVSGE